MCSLILLLSNNCLLLRHLQFNGLTPLAESMERKVLGPVVFQQAAGGLAKPILIITITDGEYEPSWCCQQKGVIVLAF